MPAQTPHKDLSQVAVAVLAAGLAIRFGGPKLAAPLAGRPLLAWALQAALASELGPVLMVLGPGPAPLELPDHPRLQSLENPQPDQGMGTSLALAAAQAEQRQAPALVVLLGDQPLVQPSSLAAVARACLESPLKAAAASAGGRRCHPVAFGRRYYDRLAALRGDQGGRAILQELGTRLALVPVPMQSTLEVDTPGDLLRIEKLLQAGA